MYWRCLVNDHRCPYCGSRIGTIWVVVKVVVVLVAVVVAGILARVMGV